MAIGCNALSSALSKFTSKFPSLPWRVLHCGLPLAVSKIYNKKKRRTKKRSCTFQVRKNPRQCAQKIKQSEMELTEVTLWSFSLQIYMTHHPLHQNKETNKNLPGFFKLIISHRVQTESI